MIDLYRKHILDHYKNPRNYGSLDSDSKKSHGANPSCGDSITMDVSIENNVIKDIRFSGQGCAISTASASMLTEHVKGMKITEIAELEFEDIEKIMKIRINPARKKCALLPLTVLKKIILKQLKSE